MEPEISLTRSQQSTTGPYLEPDELSLHTRALFIEEQFYISSSLRRFGIPHGPLPSSLRVKSADVSNLFKRTYINNV
jgi:hypothetical protein